MTLLTVAFAALWGWGWLACRVTQQPGLSLPLTATIGLSTVIFLGGVLCLVRVAFGRTLDAVAIAGLGLAVTGWLKAGRPLPRPTLNTALASLPLLLAGWFLVRYATPPAAFNFHDDLERYFAYPVRMLAEGRFTPNPLGYLGADTLGGAAFLQGFVAAHLPLEYIGSVDLVGGLLLCLALAGFGLPPGRSAVTALAAGALLVAVNPQLVNISAVFSGTALIMATVLVPAAGGHAQPVRTAPLTGLFYAGLIALKTTFGVFVAVHLLSTALVGFAPWRARLRTAVHAGGWTLGCLAPWLAVHAPLYLTTGQAPPPPPMEAVAAESLGLFSTQALAYGSNQALYTGLALLGLALAGWWGFVAIRVSALRTAALDAALAAGITTVVAYLLLVGVVGPLMYGRDTSVRYAIPILLGVLAALVRLPDFFPPATAARWPRLAAVAGSLALAGLFLPSLAQRVRQLATHRVPLAYFESAPAHAQAQLLGYTAEVLRGSTRGRLERIQSLVPPREPIATWVMTPFLLDFRRNPIWHTDPYGLAMPWAHWPERTGYFLLEYQGYAVRNDVTWSAMQVGAADQLMLQRVQAFQEAVTRRIRRENILYQDGNYVLVRLVPP